MRRKIVSCLVVVGLAFVGLAASGCGPNYPNCNNDEDCKSSEQGQKEGKLYCVNGLCQECRSDDDCGEAGMECNAGKCEMIPNYCESDDDCSGSQVCRENRCGPECLDDSDCDEGYECKGGTCEAEAECSTDADCPDGQECRNGQCVTPPDQPECTLDTVYFAFDSSNLSSTARSKLDSNADCIQKRSGEVQLEGHCDERGTNEYNVALGERRAKSVYDYLTSLGVPNSKLSTISYGEERLARQCGLEAADSCHEDNRRVEFSW